MKIAVIIPTLNEADNIRSLIPRIHDALKNDYTIVIVDDNSSDGTQKVAQELANTYPIKIVPRPYKLGLASAAIDGMNSIIADAYIIMDADLSHPPELLPTIRSQIETHDLVVASRMVRGGSTTGWPLRRTIVSRIAIALARPLTPVKDATSGFFAVRRECVEGVELTPIGFKIGLECFVKTKWNSYIEVPYAFADRDRGHSKLGRGVLLSYIKHLSLLYTYKIGLRRR